MNGDEECIASFQEHQAEFGYLYYEHSDRKEEEAMLRAQLEKQLHELLYPLGFARTIGGAFGTKYAYIDVAVFDLSLIHICTY